MILSKMGWGKSLLLVVMLLYVSCLGLLSFYNHPSTDDYFLGLNTQSKGFWGYQIFIYKHWGGRYFTNFIGALFAYNQILFRYYSFHTLLLLILTFLSNWFLFFQLDTFLLDRIFGKKLTAFIGLLSIDVATGCYPEVSTGFYWFSSAITYQLSAVLLSLFFGCWVAILYGNPNKGLVKICCFLLVIAINGSNEVASLILGLFCMVSFFFQEKKRNSQKVFFLALSILYITTIYISTNAPGNSERLNMVGYQNNFLNVIPILFSTLARVGYILWCLARNPLYCFCCFSVFIFGVSSNDEPNRKLINYDVMGLGFFQRLIFGTMLIAGLLILALFPILFFSGGSMPERAVNLMVFVAGLLFIGLFVIVGVQSKLNTKVPVEILLTVKSVLPCLLLIGIVGNQASKDVFLNLFSAPLYSAIMKEREINLKQTKHGQAIVNDYETAKIMIYPKLFGNKQKAIVKNWVLEKPSFLFVMDDLENKPNLEVLKQYFGINDFVIIHDIH